MEFENLTPFSVLNYSGYDTNDQEYEVVTLCAEYKLIESKDDVSAVNGFKQVQTVYTTEVNDEEPISLCMADEFYEEPNTSSILQESDIVPYKPKCDVLIQGHAYSNEPCTGFKASVALYRLEDESSEDSLTSVLNKELWVTGSRQWKRSGDAQPILTHNFLDKYQLTNTELTQKVPLRYEYAFGGQFFLENPKKTDENEEQDYNEACYRNPIGKGWFEQNYFAKLKEFKHELPEFFAVPQIMPANDLYDTPIITEQQGEVTAQKMAEIEYGTQPAGFSATHRSWAPRLALAGTYDDDWLENRHPNYPKDFDFAYWNSAPEDQQIDFPDLTKPHTLVVNNLTEGGGKQVILLPRHRAFVLATMNYEYQVQPMNLDTLVFYTDKMTLKMVWRLFIPKHETLFAMEARFIVDPKAPWMTYEMPDGTIENENRNVIGRWKEP